MISEDRILKVHVGQDRFVWFLDGDRLPQCSRQAVADFVDSDVCTRAAKIRALGHSANSRLLGELHLRKLDNPLFSLEVASPGACRRSSHLRSCPAQVLLDMRLWGGSPSQGGWHEFGTMDYPSYAISAALEEGGAPEAVGKFLRSHPAWPAVSLIPHLNHTEVARIVADVVDPRFFVDRRRPDRLSRLGSYLGLDPASQSRSEDAEATPRQRRCGTAVRCWRGPLPEGKEWEAAPNFLWRRYRQHGGGSRGELRASQMWVAFLRHTWLDALYQYERGGESLFVPEYFFTPDEADWFRSSLRESLKKVSRPACREARPDVA